MSVVLQPILLAVRELRSYPEWGQALLAILAVPPLAVGLVSLGPAPGAALMVALLLAGAALALHVRRSITPPGDRSR